MTAFARSVHHPLLYQEALLLQQNYVLTMRVIISNKICYSSDGDLTVYF